MPPRVCAIRCDSVRCRPPNYHLTSNTPYMICISARRGDNPQTLPVCPPAFRTLRQGSAERERECVESPFGYAVPISRCCVFFVCVWVCLVGCACLLRCPGAFDLNVVIQIYTTHLRRLFTRIGPTNAEGPIDRAPAQKGYSPRPYPGYTLGAHAGANKIYPEFGGRGWPEVTAARYRMRTSRNLMGNLYDALGRVADTSRAKGGVKVVPLSTLFNIS